MATKARKSSKLTKARRTGASPSDDPDLRSALVELTGAIRDLTQELRYVVENLDDVAEAARARRKAP